MPTQPVIEKLEKLQAELETVSVAIKHIDKAAKVAESSSDILKNINNIFYDFKQLEEKHHYELLELHKEKIEALEKHFQSLLNDFIENASQLTKIFEDLKKLEKVISDYFSDIKKINFPERLDKIDNQISAINIGLGNIQTSIQQFQSKIDNVEKNIIEKLKENAERQSRSQTTFLEKLFQHVSAIENTVKSSIKKQQINIYITWCIIIITFLILILKTN
jgi:chromosome segregation ATPase